MTRDAFGRLFSNIEDNIRNRREQQARKSSRAELAAQQMAAGLRPKANITYTDEGLEFDNAEARDAYYNALGSRIGASDMSRQGGTETTSQVVGGEDHMAKIAAAEGPEGKARQQMMDNAAAKQIGIVQGIDANNPALINKDGSINPNVGTLAPDMQAAGQALRETLGATANTASQLQSRAAEQAPATTAPAPTVPAGKQWPHIKGVGLPTPNVNVPAVPSTTDKTQDKTKTSNSTTTQVSSGISASNNVREHDQASFEISEGDKNIKDQQYIQTTTKVTTGRMDDVKTNFWDLMGMKAAEDDAMSAYRSQNPQSAALEKGTFETALAKRQADMQRWEAASTQDGTQVKTEKGGDLVYDVKGGSVKGSITRKDALAPKIEIKDLVKMGDTNVDASSGGGDASKSGLGQLVDSSGKTIGATFNTANNRYEFDNATIDGVEMQKLIKGEKDKAGNWTRENDWTQKKLANGRIEWTLKSDPSVKFSGEPASGGQNWKNVVGTLPQGMATNVFQDAGQYRLGTATQQTGQEAQRAANVNKTIQETQAMRNQSGRR